MFPLVGAVLGLVGSMLPEGLKLYKDRQDKKHEIELMKLQMDYTRMSNELKLEEIGAQADIEEAKALYKFAEPKMTGVRWVDATLQLANGLVRPITTAWIVGIYSAVKYAQFRMTDAATWLQALNKIWTDADMTIMFTVIMFWFGKRSFEKAREFAKT